MRIIPVFPQDIAGEEEELAAETVPTIGHTFDRTVPSRRTFAKRVPSRRTFGRRLPSRRTFGRRVS